MGPWAGTRHTRPPFGVRARCQAVRLPSVAWRRRASLGAPFATCEGRGPARRGPISRGGEPPRAACGRRACANGRHVTVVVAARVAWASWLPFAVCSGTLSHHH